MTIGEKIRKRRKELDMTMEDLGQAVGVGRSAINKYEKNMIKDMKESTIRSLARALNVSPIYLLDDDNDNPDGIGMKRLEVKGSGKADFGMKVFRVNGGSIKKATVKSIYTRDPELDNMLKVWKVSSPKAKKAAVEMLRVMSDVDK